MIDDGKRVIVIVSGHPSTKELAAELANKLAIESEIQVISDPKEIDNIIADRNVPPDKTIEDLVGLLKDFKPYKKEEKYDEKYFAPKRNKKGKKLKN